MAGVTTTIKVNGVPIDPTQYTVAKSSLLYWAKDGVPYFRFAIRGGAYLPRPNPFVGGQPCNKEITVYQNFGHGDVLVFRGDCWDYDPHSSETGMIYEFTCLGLRDRADRVPVTDGNTGIQQMTFNYDPNDPLRIDARMGRTLGQMILEVLEQVPTAQAFQGYSIGNYATTGTGAAFTANVTGGSVSSATQVSGGNGYSLTTPPTVIFVGGNPTRPAQATANVANVSGSIQVVSLSFSDHGVGYQSDPTIIISGLPATTLNDLAAITHIPPHEVEFAGERVLTAIEGNLKLDPNYFLYVQPDGTIRFFDSRKFGTTTVSISDTTGHGARAAALVYNGAIIEIYPYWGGWNYTSPTITITDTAGGSGCTATATVTNGSITDIVVTAGGSGYGGALLTFTVNQEIEFPPIKSSVQGCFQRVVLLGANLIEPVILRLSDGSLIKDYGYAGMSPAQAEAKWKLSDWNDPSQNTGAAQATVTLTATSIKTGTAGITITNAGSGGTAGTYNLAFSGTGSGATGTYTIGAGGTITSATITAGGSGFTAVPTASFPSGGITGAAATLNLTPTTLGTISLTDPGFGYTGTAPRVVIVGGGSPTTVATATTTLDSSGAFVSTIAFAAPGNNGAGYTLVPTVYIEGPETPQNDYGTCTVPNTTTVVVTSSDPSRSWAANAWDQSLTGMHGQVLLALTTSFGLNTRIRRKVVANTALSPGGTSTLTLDQPLPIAAGGGAVAYNTYALRGTAGGANDVYRKYTAADPWVQQHLSNQPFSVPVAWHDANNSSVSLTNSTTCSILYSSTGQAPWLEMPMGVDVDPDSGTFWLNKPAVMAFGTLNNLEAGGSNVDGIPDDIVILAAVNFGALMSVCPANSGSPYTSPQFSGTSHTVEGMSTTKTYNVLDWRDPSNQANMDLLSCALLDTVKDTRFEGPIPCDSLFIPGIFPGAVYNVTSDEGNTGFESMNAPGMSLVAEWDESLIVKSTVTVSNRKDPYSGQEFTAPSQVGAFNGAHDENVFNPFGPSQGASLLPGFQAPVMPTYGIGAPGATGVPNSAPDTGMDDLGDFV